MSLLQSLPTPSPLVLSLLAVLLVSTALRILSILPSRHANPQRRKDGETVTVGAFLGSGGHTTELLQLLSSLPSSRYVHRTYLYSSGDRMSPHKARSAEAARSSAPAAEEGKASSASDNYVIVELPRAREVHQSFLSTPISVLGSFFACLSILLSSPPSEASATATRGPRASRGERRPWVDVLIMNGPGTCVPLVAAVYVLKFLDRPVPKLIYIESFARVRSLSLTARILRHLVDRFVVQWDAEAEERAAVALDKRERKRGEAVTTAAPTATGVRTIKAGGAECRGWLI